MKWFWALLGALLVLPWSVGAQSYLAERVIDETDATADTDNGRFMTMAAGRDTMYCEFDVTENDGSATLGFWQCDPQNITQGTCTGANRTDRLAKASAWFTGTAVSGVGNDRVIVLPYASVGEGGTQSDKEIVSVLPPVWIMDVNLSASTNASFTVDCVYW